MFSQEDFLKDFSATIEDIIRKQNQYSWLLLQSV